MTRFWHARFWIRAQAGEAVDFRRFFRDYRSAVDWPACEFYRELLAAYPQAKVVLTLRDADEWYDSVSGTLWQIRSVLPAWFPRSVWQMQEDVIWQGRFRGAFADREQALATYRAHLDEVRRTVPAAQLLDYRVADGWGPLCAFLGRPVPQGVPFPRLNDRTFFGRLLGALRWNSNGEPGSVGLALKGINLSRSHKESFPPVTGQAADGTEQWNLTGKQVGQNSFTGIAYTSNSSTASRDIVLQVLSTLSFP